MFPSYRRIVYLYLFYIDDFSPSRCGDLLTDGGQKRSLSRDGGERRGCSTQTRQISAPVQLQQAQLVKR